MPPKKADIFTKDIEFILIDLVECRPILWDHTSELYKRVDLKDAVWEEVARSLGSQFSGPIVASRFKSMRDTFMSNLRRVKDSKRSGKGTADIYIPKWSLYDRLKFLQKTVVQSTSTTNLTISSEKLDNIVSQVEETSNESLKQYQLHIAEDNQEKEIVNEELPVINIYYNDSMEKFMIAPTEESSDSTTDLSVSSQPASSAFQPLQPICAPVLQTTLHNETVSTSTALTSSALTSSASKIKDVENKMYTKRGYAKRKANFDPNDNSAIMVEAVTAIKTLCKQDPNNSTNSSNSSTDSAHSLGLFIAARLREMTTDQRKLCENEILKILSQF